MPSDRRTRTILVDERHGERAGFDGSPCRGAIQQWMQKLGYRPLRAEALVVGRAKERHSPPCDDPAHFEVRELDAGDVGKNVRLFSGTDEVVAIGEARRRV